MNDYYNSLDEIEFIILNLTLIRSCRRVVGPFKLPDLWLDGNTEEGRVKWYTLHSRCRIREMKF